MGRCKQASLATREEKPAPSPAATYHARHKHPEHPGAALRTQPNTALYRQVFFYVVLLLGMQEAKSKLCSFLSILNTLWVEESTPES